MADSLEKLLNKAPEDTNKVILLGDLCWELGPIKPSRALDYGQQALDLSKKLAYKKGIIQSLSDIGASYKQLGNFKKSLEFYNECLKLKINNRDSISIIGTYQNIAVNHTLLGNFPQALSTYYDALSMARNSGLIPYQAVILNNIGTLYRKTGKYNEALSYYNEALVILEKIDNKIEMANVINNMASIYEAEFNDKDKALAYYEKSFKMFEALKNNAGMASCANNLGRIYLKMNDFRKAEQYFDYSLLLRQELKDKNGIIITMDALAELYFKKGNILKALEYQKEILSIAKQIGSKTITKDSYKHLSDYYFQMNDLPMAYQNLQLYLKMNDSIYNEENSKQMVQMQSLYETEKKEQQIELLNKDKALQNAEIKKQNTVRNYLSGIIFLALLLGAAIFKGYKHQQHNNRKLTSLNEEINLSKQEIEFQKAKLEEKNKDITDSINYAQQIQQAILPFEDRFKSNFKNDYFINFKPRDIVSGDFYWCTEKEGKVFLAVVDCTGHGVPGAFMSMVGSAALTNIVIEKGIVKADEILSQLNIDIRKALNQEQGINRDGMDMVLCVIDKEEKKVHFSGAMNPLYLIQKNELIEIKANKVPIGGAQTTEKTFTSHTISIETQTTLYLTTDGYSDQFGGEQGKKYKSSNFKKLLLSMQDKTMQEQSQLLNSSFENWKGDLEQLDDVCIIGVKI